MQFLVSPSDERDGYTQVAVLITTGEDLRAAMERVSEQHTMIVWTCRTCGYIDKFTLIDHEGHSDIYEGRGRWHVASLHTVSDSRLYLCAIRSDGGDPHDQKQWACGIVDGEIVASGQILMLLERTMRIPTLLNLLRD